MFTRKNYVLCQMQRVQSVKCLSEILPKNVKKVYSSKYKKKKLSDNKKLNNDGPKSKLNEFNIQLLSRNIYEQIFNNNHEILDKFVLEKCLKSLKEHGISYDVKNDIIPEVNFKLPPLQGSNLADHFFMIGEKLGKPYKNILEELLISIPKKPKKWLVQAGWTRYCENSKPESVEFPLENGYVFDVEVCMKAGKLPTIATAVSNKAWYAWVSDALIIGSEKPIENQQLSSNDLIPFETSSTDRGGYLNKNKKQTKIIIGHNISYDRARIKEQYWLEQTGMRFLDTMALHICLSGLTSSQRAILKSGKLEEGDNEWANYTSLNNLKDVCKLYCGTVIEKDTRDLFVNGSLQKIYQHFDEVLDYCANDVQSVYNVLQVLYPMFLKRFPHPVTFAGMIELSTAYLPVNSNWERYISDSQQAYEDLDIEKQMILAKRADQACHLFHNDEFKRDLWMWDQDWSIKELTLRKTAKKSEKLMKTEQSITKNSVLADLYEFDEEFKLLTAKFAHLEKTNKLLPMIRPLLPGYPSWYKKLCTKPSHHGDWIPGPHLISTSMQISPKLLCLTWEGYPLHFIRELGWGFLVPVVSENDQTGKIPIEKLIQKCPLSLNTNCKQNLSIDISKEVEKKISWMKKHRIKSSAIQNNIILEDCCWFIKLPHKDGPSHRVGNPLAKDFLTKFSENVLLGDSEGAQKVLFITNQLSYWRNNRARIMEQMVIWIENKFLPPQLRGDEEKKYGAIIPQLVVCGTLTRRAVEPTWMTASNANSERIGSELRSMVQAPKGYKIVGADVDSQELWIASLIGDAHCAKTHGATPFGWMTISGNKSDGTDMHSVTAKASGISRDQAKVINYARIYGAGQNFAEQLIKQFNPTMSEIEVRSKAAKMFQLTKGKRIYRLKNEYHSELTDKAYTRWQAIEIAKAHGLTLDEMFFKPKWIGGTESEMFNRLEEIANDPEPKTPFLNGRLSRAIEPRFANEDRFLPTRINWVVQSGAVDFLHLMLVCMRWLMDDKARFCLSFHDEIRYLVKEDYKYKAALAMHVTNLLTRAFCSLKLGLNDLPQSVAFFSSVEVDSVLRKDSKQDCKTPSNPHGLYKGYGIPFGESLDIYDAVEKANGHTEWWKELRDVKSNKKKTCPNGSTSR